MSELKNFNAIPVDEKAAVMLAVNALCENNPDIAKQLTRLADIKKNQPLIWRVALLKLGL